MTDITELALIAKIKKQTENFDTVVLKEWEVLALVEALEKAQKRIAELDRKNCELDSLTQRWAVERAENADHIAELESHLESADKLQDSAFRSGLQHGFSLGQTDDQKGYEQSMAAYSPDAGIKVEDE
ncbi:TPA: hypothetical protein N7L47_003845 [Escherichia coli]|nr:hypothetical protein [Escherichia coli]